LTRGFLRRPASSDIALIDAETGAALSYAELELSVQEAGAALAAERKSLLLLFCRNTLSAVLLYLAARERGHAVALVDADSSPSFKQRLLELYQPRFAWAPEGVSLPEGWGEGSHWQGGTLWDLPAPDVQLHPTLAVLLATSGTTGSPKFVRLSESAVEANAAAIAQGLELSTAERAITSLPIFYSYGLSVLNSHLWAGASTVLTSSAAVESRFWDTIRSYGCSSFGGVPFTYQVLARLGFENMDVPSLRTLTQAGGRLEPRLVQRFHAAMAARGGRFFVMYGQTEAVARIAILPAEALPEKLGSVGKALAGGELHIDPSAAPSGSPEGVGEVVYRGPNVMLGYADTVRDLARGDDMGGELRTGDLGYLDADGLLFITGRSRRIGKIFGLRVNLDDAEGWLSERGPAAVVDGGDRLLVFCAFGDAAALEQLHQEMAKSLRVHRSGLEFRRIAELPTLASGKVDYQRLCA
jgi:acyl-CoA synthetase (AMP-forming)/AMP-acid ligase II